MVGHLVDPVVAAEVVLGFVSGPGDLGLLLHQGDVLFVVLVAVDGLGEVECSRADGVVVIDLDAFL